MKELIQINILTRTSNRPHGMRHCYDSVKQQTYKNIRHIVAYDTPSDLDYLQKLDVDLIKVDKVTIYDVKKGRRAFTGAL